MGTNCAPPVAVLFLFCYERDFMLSSCCLFLTVIKQMLLKHLTIPQDIDNLLNIDNSYFWLNLRYSLALTICES